MTPRRQPECGQDFCCLCGDCLAYNGSDPCHESSDEVHVWQVSEHIAIPYPQAAPGNDYIAVTGRKEAT